MSRSGGLSEEDRILWSLVARSAKPLAGRKAVPLLEPPAPEERFVPTIRKDIREEPVAKAGPLKVTPAFDVQIRNKLAKGRLPIQGRVDLHGMTLDEAYWLLLSFLRRAQQNGVRYALIITGKGSSSNSDGALRRSVPHWLSTAPFRPLVSGHDDALRQHGGGGALYIRIRRGTA